MRSESLLKEDLFKIILYHFLQNISELGTGFPFKPQQNTQKSILHNTTIITLIILFVKGWLSKYPIWIFALIILIQQFYSYLAFDCDTFDFLYLSSPYYT